MRQCGARNDSDLRGIPSLSLSVCLENRTDEDVGRRKEDEVESPTFTNEYGFRTCNPQRKTERSVWQETRTTISHVFCFM
jgi:hypothetical protein